MNHAPRPPPTALFTVRFWQEVVDTDQVEWRGEVKRIATGEARYFRDWQTLIQHMSQMLKDQSLRSEFTEEDTP